MGEAPRDGIQPSTANPHPDPPRSPAAPGGQGAESFAPAAIIAARIAQQLGWTPDTFWAATPADLRHALGPLAVADSLDARALAALMKEFPDG